MVKFVSLCLDHLLLHKIYYFLQDLTGEVTILTYPNHTYLWTVGEGSFSNVVKGEWRKKSSAENEPPVSMILVLIAVTYRLTL
jgi:hypothetical protein